VCSLVTCLPSRVVRIIDRVPVKEFLWSRRYFINRMTLRRLPFDSESLVFIHSVKP